VYRAAERFSAPQCATRGEFAMRRTANANGSVTDLQGARGVGAASRAMGRGALAREAQRTARSRVACGVRAICVLATRARARMREY